MPTDAEFAAKFVCPRCQNQGATTVRIAVSGAGLSRFFDVQNRRFLAASCNRCGYTEFYKLDRGGLAGNIFDLLSG